MQEFRRPRWIVLSLVVVVIFGAFIALGNWQLNRLETRRATNAVIADRLTREPIAIEELFVALETVQGVAPDEGDFEHTPVVVTGRFVDEGRVLVRSQVSNGRAGTHAVYPLILGDGSAILVNIGWIPFDVTPAPIAELYGDGTLEIRGLVRASQQRPAVGREEPPGLLDRVERIDIDRIQEQVTASLAPFFIQLTDPNEPDRIPIPVPLPDTSDGPHLAYAIQWYAFALISVVGYGALIRKELIRLRRRQRAGTGSQDPPQPSPLASD